LSHTDEEIFVDAKTFKWDRFLPLPDGSLPKFYKNGMQIRNPVNPFGGGPTLCPGRKFAKAEIKAIIAVMLVEYDIRFADDLVPSPPKLRNPMYLRSNGTPASDVLIEIQKRRY